MGVAKTLKKSLIAGIVLVAPLVVTYVALQFVFSWLRGFLDPIIEETGLVDITASVEILAEIVALVMLLAFVALLGYLAQRSVGAWVFGLFDRAIGLIPIVSVIYGSVRQVSDALVNQQSRYENVVVVEYPRQGLYVLGFITSESPSPLEAAVGTDLYNVYLPGSPNPTQGNFVLVPTERVTEVDLGVSRAIRLLVTTGIADREQDLQKFQEDVKERLDEQDVGLEDYR
ncbi:MAG: putative membrane protein [Haloarculaceae archaeon]|jgi:uncharacterized membrane protein